MTTRGKSRLARRFDNLVDVQRERMPAIDRAVHEVDLNVKELQDELRGLTERVDRICGDILELGARLVRVEELSLGYRAWRRWLRVVRLVSTVRNRKENRDDEEEGAAG